MTEINVVIDENKDAKVPQFKDLAIGQYFKVISDYYDEDTFLYVKLPLVKRSEERLNINLNYSSSPKFYNCFNITKNKLEDMSDETYCHLIDNVEIHI